VARHLAIETAYARNQRDPLVLDLDGAAYTMDPTLDVGRLAVLFNRFQDGLTGLADEDRPLSERIEAVAAKKPEGVQALTECITPAERERFTAEAPDRLDVTALANIITWLLSEVSGQATPTPPPSSSDGSAADGPTSTDGAPPEESTPSPSPQTVP
jgi:hypothetical protein